MEFKCPLCEIAGMNRSYESKKKLETHEAMFHGMESI